MIFFASGDGEMGNKKFINHRPGEKSGENPPPIIVAS
jgi:hypothetical protein